MDKQYKEIYDKLISFEERTHEANQRRIRVGLKLNLIVPLIFLILSFALKSAKLIFLLLWILTLFGIAGYLMYVEYSDYKLMQQLKELGIDKVEEKKVLIGKNLEEAEKNIQEKLDKREDKQKEEKQAEVTEDEEHN